MTLRPCSICDGGGVDTYDFSNFTTDLDVDLRPGQWTTTSSAQLAKLHYNGSKVATGNIANALQFNGDLRSLIENAVGGVGDDTIRGNSADNSLWGAAGDDALRGDGGDDKLYGQAGQDRLIGGDGNDTLGGGGGPDILRGNGGSDVLRGSGDSDRLMGGGGQDRLVGGGGDDVIRGGPDDDRLIGGPGDDRLAGGGGDDVIRGGPDGDWLIGGPSDDRLMGGGGNDRLDGGPGADMLIGGDGEDMFVFRSVSHSPAGAMDSIRFVSGIDTINLRPIDPDITKGGNQAFSFIDSNPFSQTAGELNFRNNVLSGDVDGDGTADFAIYFAGVATPVDSDFIL